MATKSAKALIYPATLKSLCPPVMVTPGAPGTIILSAGAWQTLTSLAGNTFLFWESSIDLSAYTRKDLTWVTTDKEIQEPGNFKFNLPTVEAVEFIEFVSNTPFNRDRLTLIADDLETQNAAPGMMGSRVNFENIIMGRWREFSTDSTIAAGSAVALKSSSFGSCEPSASGKLYTYCMMKAPLIVVPGQDFFIPGRRFLLAGSAVQEPDLEYVMRLRRSYVLQE